MQGTSQDAFNTIKSFFFFFLNKTMDKYQEKHTQQL